MAVLLDAYTGFAVLTQSQGQLSGAGAALVALTDGLAQLAV